MSFPFPLDAETLAAIAAVPYERTPNYARVDAPHPWRPWHQAIYGGSPIPICLDPASGVLLRERLFLGPSRAELGDIDRPEVDSIVNLCELNDPWPLSKHDRRWQRGEGMFGYTWEALDADARDVAKILRGGRRVLIHCMAGVNCSATLTCAVLMHIEGISAETALRRVQRFHAPAKPEDRHWQALRQLEIALRAERANRA